MVLDILGLIFCCLTLFFLLGQRWRKKRSIARRANTPDSAISDRASFKVSGEQFETVFDAARKRESALHELIKLKETETSEDDSSGMGLKNGKKGPNREYAAGGAYAEAMQLADRGFGLNEISESVGIPIAETRLIMKLIGGDRGRIRQEGSHVILC